MPASVIPSAGLPHQEDVQLHNGPLWYIRVQANGRGGLTPSILAGAVSWKRVYWSEKG